MTTGERVRYLRKELLHLTLEKFGEPLGVGKTAISSIETDVRGLTNQMIKAIVKEYGCDEQWLRTGEGEPYAPKTLNQKIVEWVNRVMADKDDAFRKRFVIALTNMSDEGWIALEKFIDDLLDK